MRLAKVVRMLAASLFVACLATPAVAESVRTFTTSGTLDDVMLDVESAIIDKGLVIDFKGDVGGMLKRTGSDVGAKGDSIPVRAISRSAPLFCRAR